MNNLYYQSSKSDLSHLKAVQAYSNSEILSLCSRLSRINCRPCVCYISFVLILKCMESLSSKSDAAGDICNDCVLGYTCTSLRSARVKNDDSSSFIEFSSIKIHHATVAYRDLIAGLQSSIAQLEQRRRTAAIRSNGKQVPALTIAELLQVGVRPCGGRVTGGSLSAHRPSLQTGWDLGHWEHGCPVL